jgi:hypothetical protein
VAAHKARSRLSFMSILRPLPSKNGLHYYDELKQRTVRLNLVHLAQPLPHFQVALNESN